MPNRESKNIALTEPAFPRSGFSSQSVLDGWRFNWGHCQIIIWGNGLPDCTFSSLILDIPPGGQEHCRNLHVVPRPCSLPMLEEQRKYLHWHLCPQHPYPKCCTCSSKFFNESISSRRFFITIPAPTTRIFGLGCSVPILKCA